MKRMTKTASIIALGGAAFVAFTWLRLERSIKPRKSTVDFWRLSKMPLVNLIEGYFYLSRTSTYLKTWPLEYRVPMKTREAAADGYHGKVVPLANARRLVKIDQPVPLTDLEQVIPYSTARRIVLEKPESLAALECACRAQKKNPCQPTDVCLVVGEPFASFVLDHQPRKSRRITPEEAVDILEAEERRGHIHTAWFKDVLHDRFYAICNCCRCCCLGMKSFLAGSPRLAHSGYRPAIDKETCIGCGTCSVVCPFGAADAGEGNPVLDCDACMGCGLCVSHCPQRAISLEPAPDRGVPLIFPSTATASGMCMPPTIMAGE